MIQSAVRRALAISLVLHAAVGVLAWATLDDVKPPTELVDIELAPPPPPVEALPAEVAQPPAAEPPAPSAPDPAASTPPEPGDGPTDAGVDAPPDAPPDAAPRKRKPDAGVDAGDLLAEADAGVDGDGGTEVALGDAGVLDDALAVAAIEPGGDGAGGDGGPGGMAQEAGSGSGAPGATNEPAVEGAPTTAGTAANLLAYFPAGHVVTALIRFDRLRGTEWAAQTERLLQPMPDYQVLFGPRDAGLASKLDTLVISSPRPKDAAATTLVAHTRLDRPALRAFLGATSPVAWSGARGGLLGKRSGRMVPGDRRVILSPFRGWFVLAQPQDLGALTAPAAGDLDAIEARGKLPAWLGGLRKIEAESGDPRGPALVVTIGLGGERVELGADDFGLGVSGFATPVRLSLAMELVKQGWLVRGNMRFKTDADAAEFVAAAEAAKQRIADSRALQLAIGKPVARVIANLSFQRTGPRLSYATSISIADARQIMAVTAQQLDAYFRAGP